MGGHFHYLERAGELGLGAEQMLGNGLTEVETCAKPRRRPVVHKLSVRDGGIASSGF